MIQAAKNKDELFRIATSKTTFGVIEVGRNDTTKMDLSADNETLAAKIKELADPVLKSRDWHCFAKITKNNPLEWSLWAGPLYLKPQEGWPDDNIS